MKKLLSLALASAALAYSPSVSAADFVTNFTPLDDEFEVVGNPFTGLEVVTADFGRSGLTTGTYIDNYLFSIGPVNGSPIGLGTGSVITSFSFALGNSLVFDSVTFNNGVNTFVVPITVFNNGAFGEVSGVNIFSGNLNTLSLSYAVAGEASYGGQATFTPGGIPEPMTWAMMIIGFAAIGFAMRRRKQEVARVRYAF